MCIDGDRGFVVDAPRAHLTKKASSIGPVLEPPMHWNLVQGAFDSTRQQLIKLVTVDGYTPLGQVMTSDKSSEEGMVRQSTLLAKELRLISQGFSAGTHIGEADLRDRISRISAGVELLEYAELLSKFQEALTKLFADGKDHRDVQAIRDLCKEHTRDSLMRLRLVEVPVRLERLRVALRGLQVFQVVLITSILDSFPVVNFLRAEPDFATQNRIVTGEMQGSMHIETLHHLAVAERFLRRVVPALRKEMPIAGLDDLAGNVIDLIATEEHARTNGEAISHTQAHLAEIQRWFSAGVSERSAGKTVSEVRSLLESGVFFACSPKRGGGLEGERAPGGSVDGRMRASEVVERIRETVFAVGEVSLPQDDRAALRVFLKSHEAAEACRKLVDRAELAGLPAFQNVRHRVGRMGDIDEIWETTTAIRNAISDWRAHLTRTLTSSPRLHFLDFVQLLEAIRLVGGTARADHVVVSKLAAYVCACFLDVTRTPPITDAPDLGASMRVIHFIGKIARKLIRDRLGFDVGSSEDGDEDEEDEGIPDNDGGDAGEEDFERGESDSKEGGSAGGVVVGNGFDGHPDGAAVESEAEYGSGDDARAGSPPAREPVATDVQMRSLEMFAEIVDAVEQEAVDLEYVQPLHELAEGVVNDDEGNVTVWHTRNLSPTAVFGTIVALCEGVPSVAQVLWCDNDTSEEDTVRFLERSRALPYLQYFMVGVDLLSSVVREGLVQQLVVDNTRARDEVRLGRLCVVVTGPVGAESFAFLPRATFADTDVRGDAPTHAQDAANAAKLNSFGAGRAFARRTVVVGAECDGKTTFCRDVLNAACSGDGTSQCSLAVHESFSIGPTAEWYLRVSPEAPSIGLHVNVLTFRRYLYHELMEEEREGKKVYNPVDNDVRSRLQRLRRFLHGLLYSGLIADPDTGALTMLRPGTAHVLMVELPALVRYDPATGRHPFLDHVPAEALGFDNAGPTFPLKIDPAAREVAFFFFLFRSDGLTEIGGAFPPVPTTLTADEARRILDREIVEHSKLGRSVMAKAQFIAHMAERVIFLRKHKDACIKYREVPARGTFKKLFEIFVRECVLFVDGESLVGDWSELNGISCRPMPVPGADEATEYMAFNLLYIRRTEAEARAAVGLHLRERVLCTDTAADPPTALSLLRAAVNTALGLNAGGDKGLSAICAAQVRAYAHAAC